MKNWLVCSVVALTMISSGASYADPNALLGEAIKNRSLINENTPTEGRLSAYETILKNLDQIVSAHPTSDQAIKILSNQAIGDFDPQILRSDYIKELTNYYDTVCETSPNYACLGFVSLSAGQAGCIASSSVRDVVEAHRNLRNSARVFIGQGEKPAYISLVLNEYRTCIAKSKYKVTDYSKDFFASELIDLLLQSNEKETAKAIIQNMKTPSFKVQGVLSLSAYDKKPFDRAFFDRLKTYVEKKVKDQNGNQQLAALDLIQDNFDRGKEKISYNDVRWGFRTGGNWGSYVKTCDPFVVRSVLEKVLDLQKSIAALEPGRMGYNKSQAPALMQQISGNTEKILNSCHVKNSNKKEFAFSAKLHGQLILLSRSKASEFRDGVLNRDWSSLQQIEYVVAGLGEHQELFEAQLGIRENAKGNNLIQLQSVLKSDRALYPVFKKLVDYGNVCKSSELLFQKIKGKTYYDDAIGYMIDANNIDMTKPHKCGDSELELLLN